MNHPAGAPHPKHDLARGEGGPAHRGDGPKREEDGLALGVAAGIERLLSLLRWLSPPDGLSFTAAATLATLERSGPCRLTLLAVQEGVTQPAMTQLVGRLQEAGLATRASDPSDRRVVEVGITAEGSALLARRRQARAERLTGMLAQLSPEDQAALAAALPAMDALTSQRDGATSPGPARPPLPGGSARRAGRPDPADPLAPAGAQQVAEQYVEERSVP